MIHDPDLIAQIQRLPCEQFDGLVYRATGQNADPTAFSTNGGRWAIPDSDDGAFSVLYTSTESDGAIAEVASYLALLTPVPNRSLRVHTLAVAPSKTLKLAVTDFGALGIDPHNYQSRNYHRTQLVGAAINFLGFDGLLAPSARWQCNNLMIFDANYALNSKLSVQGHRDVPRDEWLKLVTE